MFVCAFVNVCISINSLGQKYNDVWIKYELLKVINEEKYLYIYNINAEFINNYDWKEQSTKYFEQK